MITVRTFEMKDLGPLWYFLSIEVASSPNGYFLSEAKYANEVIHCAGLTATKVFDTPIELNVKFNSTDGVPLDDLTIYRELVGCLVYLIVTCPNLAYVVHVGLLLSSTSSLDLVVYVDSDWAGDDTDCNAVQIAHNIVFHEQMKRIEIDCYFVCQHL
ncbi:uncharacterized protein LOC114292022 [Camellia sinensis]|uniref:uncharacterized protein LOC114292022 n=1 Tax=Camellia sinensis TaxID=4442 RepID=UPI00103574E9|nr:uncharacterized protein LOC114292022 [Camellia sinensis]